MLCGFLPINKTKIIVEIKKGGKQLIKVIDNGKKTGKLAGKIIKK